MSSGISRAKGLMAAGAKADLVEVDTSLPALLGGNGLIAPMLLHAGVGDNEHVLVDGQSRKRDTRLKHPEGLCGCAAPAPENCEDTKAAVDDAAAES